MHHEAASKQARIHMNGRVYDPTVGRFMSVDPAFQAPRNTQSINPYSYVMNNPLSAVDPSGYCAVTSADVDSANTSICGKDPNEANDSGSTYKGHNNTSSMDHLAGTKLATFDKAVMNTFGGNVRGQMLGGQAVLADYGNGNGKTEGQGSNLANTDQLAGGADKGSGKFRPTIDQVFTHRTAEDPNTDVATAMPAETKKALQSFLNTLVGKVVALEAIGTGTKIDLDQIPTGSKFYKPDFAQDGDNTIIYTLDIRGYLSRPEIKPYASEYAGAGLDVFLAHEIGHTKIASDALGYPFSPGFSMQNEFNVVRYDENPYRMATGVPLRTTYTGQPIPGPINVPPQ